jgi:hypothetical protein
MGGGQSGPNGRLSLFSLILSSEGAAAEFIEFFPPLFRAIESTKQFSCATKPFSVFGADVRKQPTVIRFPTRRQARPATDNRRQVRCGPPASSSPSLSSWLVPRWLVHPTSTCRASVPLPIMARRLRRLRPSRWSWPPTEGDGTFAKEIRFAKRSPIAKKIADKGPICWYASVPL